MIKMVFFMNWSWTIWN